MQNNYMKLHGAEYFEINELLISKTAILIFTGIWNRQKAWLAITLLWKYIGGYLRYFYD